MKLTCLYTLILLLASSVSAKSAQEFKLEADALLAKGEYGAAGRAYSNAIDLDPASFNLHYLRATTYLSQGRHQPALSDFSKLLELKPEFVQAHLQMARILTKEGRWTEAEAEVKKYKKGGKEGGQEEAIQIQSAQRAVEHARSSIKSKDWTSAIDQLSHALSIGPNNVELRKMRLGAYEQDGDLDGYIGDLSRLSTLQPSDPTHSTRLAYLTFFLSHDTPRALNYIKQALHYDPDSPSHKKVHRLIRKLDKEFARGRNFMESGSWREGIKVLLEPKDEGLVYTVETEIKSAMDQSYLPSNFKPLSSSELLKALYKMAVRGYLSSPTTQASTQGLLKYSQLVLDINGSEGDVDALTGKGEALMRSEKWEEAVRVLQDAFEKSGRSNHDVMGRLQKAQKLLKQSKAKDYYKVLGVSRDADKKTIKKAFRKKAKENHPDIGGSEAKMAEINEAYEVLNDEELRTRFDNGDDPNDSTPGGGGGGHPGGHPFGHFQGHQFFQQAQFQGGGRTQFHWG